MSQQEQAPQRHRAADEILDLIDAGLQRSVEHGYQHDRNGCPVEDDRRLCSRCLRNPRPVEGDLCGGCRGYLLGDSDVDPSTRGWASTYPDESLEIFEIERLDGGRVPRMASLPRVPDLPIEVTPGDELLSGEIHLFDVEGNPVGHGWRFERLTLGQVVNLTDGVDDQAVITIDPPLSIELEVELISRVADDLVDNERGLTPTQVTRLREIIEQVVGTLEVLAERATPPVAGAFQRVRSALRPGGRGHECEDLRAQDEAEEAQ